MNADSDKLEVRQEASGDIAAIHALTELAFRDMPFAGGDEQDVIDRLRDSGSLRLSLVGVLDGKVVGQVTFSDANLADESGPWFALGPVSVRPELQSQGIGSALINQGLTEIERRGALGCILTGNPAYYQRFGFAPAPEHAPSNEPAEYFMLKLFAPPAPRGTFRFHNAFYGVP